MKNESIWAKNGSIWIFAVIASIFIGGNVFSFLRTSGSAAPVASASEQVVCAPDSKTLLTTINTERKLKGAPELVVDEALTKSSQDKLQDMITNHYYGHDHVDGNSEFDIVRSNGVRAQASSDILINGMDAGRAWTTFKDSPAHYASLTNPTYTRVGITEKCVSVSIDKVTGPSDNSAVLHTTAQEFTVIYLAAPEPVVQAPAYQAPQGGAVCRDGSRSYSTGSGTCSWHGGVSYYL